MPEMARIEGRVTCVHKANIQKMTDGLFLRSFMDVADGYPAIEHSDILIDNLCMQLVINRNNSMYSYCLFIRRYCQ